MRPIIGWPPGSGAGAGDELVRRARERDGQFMLTEMLAEVAANPALGRKLDQEIIRREGLTASEFLHLRTIQIMRETPGLRAWEAEETVKRDVALRNDLERERKGFDPVALARERKAIEESRREYQKKQNSRRSGPYRWSEGVACIADGVRVLARDEKLAWLRLALHGERYASRVRFEDAQGRVLDPSSIILDES